MKGCKKVIKKVSDWLGHENDDEWLKNMRGMLSLVATVIATLTFQSAINPPGGVRPAAESGEVQCPANSSDTNICPGEAVLAVVYSDDYTRFLVCNTICFISSLAICLLLVSGLPLNNKFFTRLLSIGMCIIITSLTLTYFFGVKMVTPDPVWTSNINVFERAIIGWFSLFALVLLLHIIRLIVWLVRKCCCAKPITSNIASQTS